MKKKIGVLKSQRERLLLALASPPLSTLGVGKTIGGGIPAGAWGMKPELSARVRASLDWDGEGREDIDVGGVGGTLAGNAVSMAGIRATLSEVRQTNYVYRASNLDQWRAVMGA